MMLKKISLLPLLLAGLAHPEFLTAQMEFSSPVSLTDSSEIFQLSRNPNNSMAFDSEGRLHVVYWSGFFDTTPAQPSFVYYQNWTREDGWSAREFIDDSFFDDAMTLQKYGGRHPSLAIDPDDTVWVSWHDHRHSNPDPPGNGINNTEIYADRRPVGGSFSSTDLRLTNTSAIHLGDNGYMAQISASSSGRISVMWHDFNVDGDISDMFVKHSDTDGNFNLSESLLSMRLTDQDDRPGSGILKESYSIADVTTDQSGTIHSVWTSGFGGGAPVYYSEIPDPASIVSETAIAQNTVSFFDPAKITTAPNGDIWVCYTQRISTEEDIFALRKPSGSSVFDSAIPLKATAGITEKAVDLEVDSNGIVHFAYIKEQSERHVVYGQYNPVMGEVTGEVQITDTGMSWQRLTIALDEDDMPYLLFDSDDTTSGDVWFVAPELPSSADHWSNYQ